MIARALKERADELARLLHDRPSAVLGDDDVLGALDRIGEVRRLVDALGVELAGEVGLRSASGDESSLSRRLGNRTPATLVEERVGLDAAEASIWCSLGEVTGVRRSLHGELLPPTRPALAAALREARISAGAAHRIALALRQVDGLLDLDERERLETTLVEIAPGISRRDLSRLCRTVPDRFDPDGAEPREEALRAQAGIRIVRKDNGLVTWIVTMDPESAGFLTAAIDARTAPRRRPRFVDDETDIEAHDMRPLGQRRLQALVDVARESLSHDDGQVAGSPVTMVVTIPLESLRTGIGTASIAGIDEPISASTARRLAADAQIIPVVLGGPSEILDQGRARRLATPAQRQALALRDGGCLWPGCTAPPGWCEVAHRLAWVLGGGTDLANLILLCPFHHHRFDHDGWTLEWRGGTPWFIPPSHIDATRRPRRGGRATLAA